jgi:O-antigen ligase
MKRVGLVLLLIAPWLFPPGWGPSPAVLPWLLSLFCLSLAALLLTWHTEPWNELWPLLAMAWLLAAALSTVIALCQFFQIAHYFSPWMSTSDTGQAFANLRQRNQFASLTQIGLLATVVLTARAVGANTYAGLAKTSWIGVAVLLAVGNAATSSRTGLLEMILLGLLAWRWAWLSQSELRKLLLWVVLAYVSAALMLPGLAGLGANHDIFARMQDGGPSCASRVNLWRTVLYLIAEKPWTGWGWGELDFAHFLTFGAGERFCEILGNAHNLPLHLAVELGIPVAFLFCGGFSVWVLRAKPWQETHLGRQLAWGVLALITLHSLLEYPLWYGPFAITLVVCVALLFASRPKRQLPIGHAVLRGNNTNPEIPLYGIRFIALITIASVLYAGWDYHRISQLFLSPDERATRYQVDTLKKAQASWLYQKQVEFAELSLTLTTAATAARVNHLALALMHYSPESRVVEKLIESAELLSQAQEAEFYRIRYQAAYPDDYEAWARSVAKP